MAEPLVSVVLVNYQGADDTIAALGHLRDVDWPADRRQIIVVDNASPDGSEGRIREAAPDAEIHQAGANLGFAGGCNLGVAQARGEFTAFLNSDARPHPQWIRAAVAEFEADPDVGCVASKVLTWDGARTDYVDAAMTWFGMGYKPTVGFLDSAAYDRPQDVLFATGSAMFIRTELFRSVGGFDDRYFMFYEDVDLGWRLNLLGHRVRYAPGSVAYHRHHASMKKLGDFREMFLLERNALMTLYKNLGSDRLPAALGGAFALAVRRSGGRADELERNQKVGAPFRTAVGGLDGGSKEPTLFGEGTTKARLAGPYALDRFRDLLPSLNETRSDLQARRQRTDEELAPLFGDALNPASGLPGLLATHAALVDLLDLAGLFPGRPKIIVVTGDAISEKMAGPAIRAWEMARALSSVADVRLLSTTHAHLKTQPPFDVLQVKEADVKAHVDWCDVIVFQGFLLAVCPWIVDTEKILVADLYDPFHLEHLEETRGQSALDRAAGVTDATAVVNVQMRRADFMLCASGKQKDFWSGQLASLGRAPVTACGRSADLDEVMAVVPFGLGDEAPVQRRHGVRGVVPGIGFDDKVILWGGGVYNWFDPLTLVRAVERLARRHPEVRLFFMGLQHPNPHVPEMRMVHQVRQLASDLGLTDRHVFFNHDWVPYEERADVLLDADVGVSTHFEHVETAYSFRTRILDYLWAGLPIVATTGDSFGNVLDREGIGLGVPPEDVDALERALEKVLYEEGFADGARRNVAAFAERFRWSSVLEPLVEFCRHPVRAPDLVSRPCALGGPPSADEPGLRRDLRLIRQYLLSGGPRLLATRALGRIERLRFE
jgi:GT2 family glycosyltransferase/glycosyltransferase involved in cell wall biosynthesis